MQRNVLHKISDAKKVPRAKPVRDEKVFIYFSPRGTAKFDGHSAPGDWVVADGRKPVSPGQEVTWQVVGGCHKLELNLPGVFEDLVVDGDTATATVRISRQLTEARGQAAFFAPPKTAASKRRVILPGSIVAEVQEHLDNHTGAAADALPPAESGGGTAP